MTHRFCIETISYTFIADSTVDSSSSFKPLNFLSQSSLYSLYFRLYKDKHTTMFSPVCFSDKNMFTLPITNCTTAVQLASTVKKPLVCYCVPVFFYATPRPTSNFLLTNCCVCIFPPANLNQICFGLKRNT